MELQFQPFPCGHCLLGTWWCLHCPPLSSSLPNVPVLCTELRTLPFPCISWDSPRNQLLTGTALMELHVLDVKGQSIHRELMTRTHLRNPNLSQMRGRIWRRKKVLRLVPLPILRFLVLWQWPKSLWIAPGWFLLLKLHVSGHIGRAWILQSKFGVIQSKPYLMMMSSGHGSLESGEGEDR